VRKKRAGSRQRTPDPKFNDVLVAQFINNLMKQGKKHQARRILYDAFAMIEERTKANGVDVFRKALSNARPVLEVKARRVGGATYQVPTEVRGERSTALAIRWLINYAPTGRTNRCPRSWRRS
jgi:small subunit ribosomal protein S7